VAAGGLTSGLSPNPPSSGPQPPVRCQPSWPAGEPPPHSAGLVVQPPSLAVRPFPSSPSRARARGPQGGTRPRWAVPPGHWSSLPVPGPPSWPLSQGRFGPAVQPHAGVLGVGRPVGWSLPRRGGGGWCGPRWWPWWPRWVGTPAGPVLIDPTVSTGNCPSWFVLRHPRCSYPPSPSYSLPQPGGSWPLGPAALRRK